VAHADWVSRRLAVTLTREQVRSSPSIDTQHPVSRQQEQQHLRHYGYPYYWVGPALWGTMPVPHADPPTPANTEPDHQSTHLRSCVEVAGYQLDATDGTLGHIADFLFDDLDWAIRWLVVDTSNWWFGHKVLISPDWVDGVDWIEQMVHIAVVRDDVQRAPEYDAVEHVNRQWEVDCYAHHKRPPYWISADDARRSKKRRLRPPVVTK
jgi:hypothetical protein